jgi:hypothetical protein
MLSNRYKIYEAKTDRDCQSWVQTDMGNAGAVANGLKEAPTTVMESVNGMIEKVRFPTRFMIVRTKANFL